MDGVVGNILFVAVSEVFHEFSPSRESQRSSKGDFSPSTNSNEKLIYIAYLDKKVNTCDTVTDEKVSSDYAISGNVCGCIWQFDDVEGAKGWHRESRDGGFATVRAGSTQAGG